jgi:hypothetical protein
LAATGQSLFTFLLENIICFLNRSAFAKLSIILIRFVSAILESLSFLVDLHEWVRVSLIFHVVLPLDSDSTLGSQVHSPYGEAGEKSFSGDDA